MTPQITTWHNLLEINVKKLYSCRAISVFTSKVMILASLVLLFATACGPTNINNYSNKIPVPESAGSGHNGATTTTAAMGGTTGDGGGGQGIVCSDEVKDQKLKGNFFVRDIYEAMINYKRTMKQVSTSADVDTVAPESIKTLVDSIRFHFGPASRNLPFANEKYWTEFIKQISFLEEDTELYPSQDANSPIALPKGCQMVQIAFWDEAAGNDNDGTLHVDRKRWRQLDQFNKIALLAHEIFFKQARKSGYKNSDFTRYKVGQLLSVEGLEPIFEQWVPSKHPEVADVLPASRNGFKFCQGTSLEDKKAQLQFYQYEGKDKLQHFVIPLLQSSTISQSLLQKAHFTFDPTKDDLLASGTNLMILGSDFSENPRELFFEGGFNGRYPRSLWYDLRYFGSGLLTTKVIKGKTYGMQSWMALLRNELLESHKQALWSDYVSSAFNPIKITLLNTVTDKKSVAPPTIQLDQGNISVKFNMSCSDYPETFVSATKRGELNSNIGQDRGAYTWQEGGPQDHTVLNDNAFLTPDEHKGENLNSNDIPQIKLETLLDEKDFLIREFDDDIDINYDTPSKRLELGDSYPKLPNVKHFLEFLKFRNDPGGLVKIIRRFNQGDDRRHCKSSKDPMGYNCEDLKHFTSDFRDSTQITAIPCEKYDSKLSRFENKLLYEHLYESSAGRADKLDEIGGTCVILKLGKKQETYLVYFQYVFSVGTGHGSIIVDLTDVNLPNTLYIRRILIE